MTKESNLYLIAAWLSPILLLMNLLCRSYNGSAKVVLLFYSSKLFVIFFKIYFKILITQIPTWIFTTTLRTAFRERKDRTLFLYFKTFVEVFLEIVTFLLIPCYLIYRLKSIKALIALAHHCFSLNSNTKQITH